MKYKLGIRREDKNKWEKRTPLIPKHVKSLKEKYNINTIIQPSKIRIYSNEEYKRSGAKIKEDLSECKIVLAVKEIPLSFFKEKQTYAFFSHTIKGQKHNIPMLKKMMEKKCNLIDYEKISDKSNRRLVFFGRFAGLAGMVDTLWAYGKRLKKWGIKTEFSNIKKTTEYTDLNHIKKHLIEIAEKIKRNGINKKFAPMIIGFAGYGNVSRGAQEIIDILPTKEIHPEKIKTAYIEPSDRCIYKVIFKEENLVQPKDKNKEFKLQEYYDHPDRYTSVFEKYLPQLDILMNCIYWDERYPRLITQKYIKNNYISDQEFNPKIIGDISADIQGAIEITKKTTTPDQPVFIYNPKEEVIKENLKEDGIAVMAVDNLPCELPIDSSYAFSEKLWPFIPKMMKADFSKDFEKIDLPHEIKKAVILHKGNLTKRYQYMNNFL
ncbi:MAG: bifunctional lysine ketoglutarate reductase /saccharopine dehydrogenase family protein [Candidatus Thermoplasmatota archaeon]